MYEATEDDVKSRFVTDLLSSDIKSFDFSELNFFSRYRRHPGFNLSEIQLIDTVALEDAVQSPFCVIMFSNDMVEAVVSVKMLEWDSQHFGIKMARVECYSSDYSKPYRLAETIDKALEKFSDFTGCRHFSIEIDVDNYCVTNALILLNFEMMDIRRIYCVNSMRTDPSYTRFLSSVRSYDDNDYTAVAPIFDALNFDTRFTRDSTLDQKKVKAMYRIWFEKLLADNGGKANTVVFERQGRIVGCGGVGETDLNIYGINRKIRSGALYGCLSEGTGGYNAVLYRFTSDALKSHGAIEASVSLNSPVTARAIEGIRPNKSVTRFCMRLYRR